MRREDMWVHGVAAVLFGLVMISNPSYADQLVFYGEIIGYCTFALGAITLSLLISKSRINRSFYYAHCSCLGSLSVDLYQYVVSAHFDPH